MPENININANQIDKINKITLEEMNLELKI